MSGWRHETLGFEIDRSEPMVFTFDGQSVPGFQGDTVASALLASGQRVLGRSFKYHRPRGLWGIGADDPNAVVDITHDNHHAPNARAPLVRAIDGMTVRSTNAWPSAKNDVFGGMDIFSRFLPAGFYYKTFMAARWEWYEPFIRRMAGLGRVSAGAGVPDTVPQKSARCDVLVIGSGAAGLAAARSAAQTGKLVWLIEDAPHLGGALRWRTGHIDGSPWQDFVQSTQDAVLEANGRVLTETTLWGAFDHSVFAAWEHGETPCHWRIRADKVILAAGSIERPLWFANNDRPGVMSAEAGMYHAMCFGAMPGRKVVIGTAHDHTYPVAQALSEAGIDVTLVDARADTPEPCGFEHIANTKVEKVEGRSSVNGALVGGRSLDCDAVLCSGGYTPSVQIWCQAGGKLDWDEAKDMLVPRNGTAEMTVVGAANGTLDLATALVEGHTAGGSLEPAPAAEPVSLTSRAMRPDVHLPGRQWVDLQNDVTVKDVALAAREGYRSVEHLKRYTTLGMATDQGRTSNFAGLATMATLTDRTIPETGTTTFRPPVRPVPLSTVAGLRSKELFNPLARLALEDAHRQASARFREYGGWLRPSVYSDGHESDVAQAEAKAARENVAIYDASPLGKLDVIGPGAAELLDFAGYIRMSTLKPGRARYGFMLSESGVVYDDGVVLRLSENHFVVSASSSHVDGVRMALEDARQDRIGPNRVFIHDVTRATSTLTVSGPKARVLLADAGISVPQMPHMGVAETEFDGGPLRVARISFTGDMSFELSVPLRAAEALRDRLNAALEKHSGRWIGLEAVMILRAEKGYIMIGKDTDGLTMPHDLGWGGPREKRKDEFIGKRSLFTQEASANNRRQLVGLSVPEGGTVINTGAHIIPNDGPRRSMGFVTSSYFSPTLGRPIALALIEGGQSLVGSTVRLFDDGIVREAQVTAPVAFDPEGTRLNG